MRNSHISHSTSIWTSLAVFSARRFILRPVLHTVSEMDLYVQFIYIVRTVPPRSLWRSTLHARSIFSFSSLPLQALIFLADSVTIINGSWINWLHNRETLQGLFYPVAPTTGQHIATVINRYASSNTLRNKKNDNFDSYSCILNF